MTIEQLPRANFNPKASPRDLPFGMGQMPAMDLLEMLKVVRRRLHILFLAAIVITGLAAAYVYTMTPLYTASSAVMVEARGNPAIDIEALVNGLPAAREQIQSEVAVLTSRDFAARVVERLKLFDTSEFNPSLRPPSTFSQVTSIVMGMFGATQTAATPAAEIEFDRARVMILDTYLDRIMIMPREGTSVIDVTSTSANPELASQIANTIADLYVVEQLEAKFQATKRANDWLTQRLADLRRDLEQAEAKVEAYRASAGLVDAGRNSTLAQQRIADINAQLTNIRVRRADLETRLRQAQALLRSGTRGTAAGEILASPTIQGYQGQEAQLEREIASLSSSVGPNHPSMLAALAARDEVRAKIGAELSRIIEGLRNDLNLAQAQEREFESLVSDLEDTVSGMSSKEGELRILEREAQASRTLYDTFLARFKQNESQDQIQTADARIISRADVPLKASFPNKPIIIGLAALLSIVVGLLLIALLEQFDRGIHSMEEVYRYLELPCLGLVPEVTTFQLAGKRPEGYVVWKPTSAFAESVRSIRTSILLSDKDVRPRVVAITSSRPNEGKTSIAITMARINAMGGRRTIIVDLDLRKPELAQRLQASKDVGAIDYLSGQATLSDVIQKDHQTGLEFIVAGRRIDNFAELLRSGQLDTLIRDLGQDYDLIVLDAPPVLAVGDTRIIARAAEKTVFVARWSNTPRDVVKLALRQLSDAGADIAGVVISMVDVRQNAKFGFGDSESFTGAFKRYYTS